MRRSALRSGRRCAAPAVTATAATGGADAPSLRGLDMTFDEFYAQVRTGVPDKMPAFSAGEIPDPYLLHLWTWLKTSRRGYLLQANRGSKADV